MRTRLLWAWYGVLATLVGIGLAHLAASLTDPASSPVLAVGSAVIMKKCSQPSAPLKPS